MVHEDNVNEKRKYACIENYLLWRETEKEGLQYSLSDPQLDA